MWEPRTSSLSTFASGPAKHSNSDFRMALWIKPKCNNPRLLQRHAIFIRTINFQTCSIIESRPTKQLSTSALKADEEKGKRGEKGEKGAPKPKPVVRKQPPGKLYDEAFSPVVMQKFLDYQVYTIALQYNRACCAIMSFAVNLSLAPSLSHALAISY